MQRTCEKPSPWWIAALAAGSMAMLLPMAGCGTQPRTPGNPAAPVGPAAPLPVIKAMSRADRMQFAGSEACVSCHAKQAGQLRSRHMRTIGVVDQARESERFRRPSDAFDHLTFIRYHTGVKDGRCVLTAADGTRSESVSPEHFFGSGHRGVTYLGTHKGQPVELRLSYYAAEKRWDFTPSQQAGTRVTTPVGRLVDAETEEGCFRCHSTALVTEAGRVRPELSLLGVGCESCHGPGKAHIQAAERREPDLRMPRLSAFRPRLSTELCGQCHRTPTDADPHNPATAKQLPRFQGLALAQSACFIKSQGKLSCITCHDPHRDADQTTRIEYNAQCGSCHAPAHAEQIACKMEPKGDCVGCHMPDQTVDIPTKPRFRTHWIKVWPQ